MLCYCKSNIEFSTCCEPFILGEKHRDSALSCMRSRYTSFCLQNIDYLIESTFPSQRKFYPKKSLLNWAKSVKWLKLEVLNYTENSVEFKAFFTDINSSIIQIHHEKSLFKTINNNWYFFEGELVE